MERLRNSFTQSDATTTTTSTNPAPSTSGMSGIGGTTMSTSSATPLLDPQPAGQKKKPCCKKHVEKNPIMKYFSAFGSDTANDDTAERIPLLSKGKKLFKKGGNTLVYSLN
jgi:hypothetical protein